MYPATQIPVSPKKPPLHQKSDQNKTKKGENAEVGNYQIRYLNVPPNTCVPDDVHESGRGREEAYLLGGRLHVRYVCMYLYLTCTWYFMVGGNVAAYVYEKRTRSTTTMERREEKTVR